MLISSKERRNLFRVVLYLISGVLAACALGISARASEKTHVLVIPPDDGYGLRECLSEKSSCGMVVADAWCEAHGLAASTGYGPADGMSGAIENGSQSDVRPGSFLVSCGE